MADLHRAGGEAVDLRRLPWQAAPPLALQVAQGNQPLEVLEGDRTVHACSFGDLIHAAWFPVCVEAEQDVAAGEISKRAEGALHIRGHIPAEAYSLSARLSGLSVTNRF